MASMSNFFMPEIGMKEQGRTVSTVEKEVGHKNMRLLIQLRWVAVIGQFTTIAIIAIGYEVALPLSQMFAVLAALIAFNIASHLYWRKQQPVTNRVLFLALLVDVASLTMQLYFSGGITNPYAFLYLLQVILGAVLLEAWATWSIVAITTLCLWGLALFSRPLDLPFDHLIGISSLYVRGILFCFALNAVLLVIFITRITRNVRTADAQLASMRQYAAEEEHIVRMGLLASGAAHELGTPLATMSVILGDWRHMTQFSNDPDLKEDIELMQSQLQRCKTIVSGILLTAGETRGEYSAKTTLVTFINDLEKEWRTTRQFSDFVFENHVKEDLAVVFDNAIKQMLYNVLDNALEASPQWLKLNARVEEASLVLTVTDKGPGFTQDMLSSYGKPYQSTKGRPGGGLGLFLSVNVARTLGGTLVVRNRTEGGAEVTIRLPVRSLALDGNT